MQIEVTLDPETFDWLEAMSEQTGARVAELVAAMVRDIRIDDQVTEAACDQYSLHG